MVRLAFIGLILSTLLQSESSALSISLGPYLQGVGPGEITIVWETDVPAEGQVSYGIESAEEQSVAGSEPVLIHRIRLGDLEAGTSYRYRVTATSGSQSVSSDLFEFRTMPGDSESFRFGALSETAGSVHAALALALLAAKVDLVIHAGDLQQGAAEDPSSWRNDFFEPAGALLAEVPLYAVPGDRDYPDDGDPTRPPEFFLDHFSLPGDERFYSFDYASAHFVALDVYQQAAEGWRLSESQRDWLESDLEATSGRPWTIVFLHFPLFGSSARDDRPWQAPLREELVELFETHGVDCVISGHDGLYSRSNRNGISYIVTGGGGAPLLEVASDPFEVNPHHHRSAASVFHHVLFDVSETRMQLKAIDSTGRIIDSETRSNVTKNVILFIGDGMGFEQIQAGRLWTHGNDNSSLFLEDRARLPYQGKSISVLPDGGITDSATAGTAIATGYQHDSNGIISEAEGEVKTTLLELARDNGLQTGFITTTDIFDATVASFGAHDNRRGDKRDLRLDYLEDDGPTRRDRDHPRTFPNLIFGGGLSEGLVDADYLQAASDAGFTFVDTRTQLLSLDLAALDSPRLLGVFDRSLTNGMLISEYDRITNRFPAHDEPDLRDMVLSALDLLSRGRRGFLLVVEDEHIDEIGHNNSAFPNRTRHIAPQVAAFDRAIGAAVEWLDTHGAAEDTLVLVTADHETGRLNVRDDQDIAPGTQPTLSYSTTEHSTSNVLLHANWPPELDGKTVDNTTTFFIMEDYLFEGVPPRIEALTTRVTGSGTTIHWHTREPSDSRVDFGIDASAGNLIEDSTLLTEHEIVLEGLAAETLYHFSVSSRDLSGLSAERIEGSFTTAGAAPVQPVGLETTDEGTFARLAWSANAAPEFAGYAVYRSDTTAGGFERIDTLRRVVLVKARSIWRYEDSGTDLGTGWRETSFDDSRWMEGAAELGYGDGDERTRLSFGNDDQNKHPTYYFRHEFDVEVPAFVDRLEVRLKRDDGAVVYLNGAELLRSNMPGSGPITFDTPADGTVDSAREDTFFSFEVPADHLRDGSNLLAVEIHQVSGQSSDISFDLQLSGLPAELVSEALYEDRGATPGTNLRYVVSAVDIFEQESEISAEACANLGAPATPGMPSAQVGIGGLRLNWPGSPTCDLFGYNVYRADSAEAPLGTPLNESPIRVSAFTDPGVSSGKSYYYAITAVDEGQRESEASARVQVDLPARQLPGDCNQDGRLNIADAVCVFMVLFTGQPVGSLPAGEFACGDGSGTHPANLALLDFNGDGSAFLNLADGVAVIQYLYRGGPAHVLGRECTSIPDCPDNPSCP